jgi:NADH dehydrogenase
VERLVVVGAGFAGVWAALAASRAIRDEGKDGAVEVVVVAPNQDLVIRPRLYQASPARHRVRLAELFDGASVEHVRGHVDRIDTGARTLALIDSQGSRRSLAWDRLVLASGSQLKPPVIPGSEFVHDVDTLESARVLDQHLARLVETSGSGRWTAVVVGSGFTGLEVATELLVRLRSLAGDHGSAERARVVLLEHGAVLAPSLGDGPQEAIVRQVAQAGVEVRLGQTVTGYDGRDVQLATGEGIPANTVVWTVGLEASPLTRQLPGRRDELGRLEVDEFLRLPGALGVYVAGDTAAALADDQHVVTQSCQYAIPLGKTAGWNAALDLVANGEGLRPFRPAPHVTCLDLGSGGAVLTTGWDRRVELVGQEAKLVKASINDLIRPPAESLSALMEQAHPAWVPEGSALA